MHCLSAPFLFPAIFWPGSHPVAVFLEVPPRDDLLSKLILETPPQIEFSSFSLYNSPHFSPFRIRSPWLTVTTPFYTWIRHPFSSSTLMDIRLYHASGTYRTASIAHTVPSLPVTLIVPVPMTSQAEPSTILTIPSSFATKKLLNSFFWKHTWTVLLNQISNRYLEKCCLQYKKPLIFRYQHHLLRLPPQLALFS